MNGRLRVLGLAACAVCAVGADFGALERDIEAQMKRQGVPGVAIAVVSEGRVVYSKGFGAVSVETGAPVTADTLFRLGSTAKVFTAAALARLESEGKVRWDAPISTYAKGLGPAFGKLTIAQLLSHTAGLVEDAPMDGPHDETALAANVLSWQENRVLAPPGRVFSYANTGYTLAGYVLEQAADRPFASAIEELVLKPLGMEWSTYRPMAAVTRPFSQGHGAGPKVLRPFPDHAGSWPPGSLFSTANEMSKLLIALMDGGKLAQRILKPQVDVPAMAVKWGHGLMFREPGVVFMTGGRVGFGSALYLLPEKRVGAVVMSNLTSASFRWAAQQAVEVLVPAAASKESAASNTAADLTADEASRYAGVYTNGAFRSELALRDGALHLRAGPRWIKVQKTGELEFRAPGGAQLERFRLMVDANGAPEFLLAEAWALRRTAGGAK